ncbi:formyl-CoA transferase [Candidatus Bathyarchaeota archaeon]|nr:formyl-CoA transferase [Candidatus Bathyarchaeota archaeon]
MAGPLEGIRVIDITKTIAGPYSASLLGDMGADVTKVEPPGTGDDFRYAAPIVEGESYYFMMANRNKKSITLNLKNEKGKKILFDLVKDADVFIESYRPGTVKRLGVDYKAIKEVNPQIVYCSISGFGQDGPLRDRAAYDLVLQSMGGIMSVTGSPGGPPTPVGVPIIDVLTALIAVYGILSSLVFRERTGKGQYVDTSLFEASMVPLMQMAAVYFNTGVPPKPGQKQEYLVPYGVFNAKDGQFVLEAGNDATWKRLCHALALDDMADDPRFQKNYDRAKYRQEILPRIEGALRTREAEEWIEILGDAGVPAGPIYNLDQIFKHPQTVHRKMIVEVDHPKAGRTKLIGIPTKFSETPAEISLPPPMLGQHTEEILQRIGYTAEQFKELKNEGVV